MLTTPQTLVQICPGKPCPIHFTPEEVKFHREDGDGWNEVQDLWDAYDGFVNRDGWTTHELYPEALKAFQQLRLEPLEELEGEGRRIFEERTGWAAV